MDIILRTCSGTSLRLGGRVVDASKTEIITRCLHSLVTSINLAVSSNSQKTAINLVIIDDHSGSECLEKIKKILETCECQNSIINLEESGNRASLKACYEYVRDYGKKIVYLVEDDYLHFPSAISEMLEAYEIFSKNLVDREVALFPVDYPDRYTPKGIYESRIVLAKSRHWRTIRHSTLTSLSSRHLILKKWEIYENLWKGSSEFINEDETVNKIWQNEAILFSPIPSLAVHLQSAENIPPFVDWQKLWKENML